MKDKKNVATMTWIHNNNYGSILQAYALQKVLQKNSYNTEIIDYNPSKLYRIINLFKSHNSLKLFYVKFQAYMSKKRSKKVGHDIDNKYKAFDDFRKNELKTTETITNPQKLVDLQAKYDVYVCGSDQIWNPDLLNPPFFFDFLSNSDKKVSYSPSFGVKSIKESKKNIIKNYLKRFSHISVREEQGQKILEDMGFDIKNMPVVLDPTLLLENNDWNLLGLDNIEESDYLICYFLKDNPIYWKSAEEISNKLNLKIKIIPNCEDSYNQKGEIIDNVGPKEWLSLIKNSKFVLTDSFHGILFSMIFNKNFYAYKRFDENSKNSQNSRVENILKKVKLEDRLFNNNIVIDKVSLIDDYSEVDEIIKNERKKSIDYLLNSIEN